MVQIGPLAEVNDFSDKPEEVMKVHVTSLVYIGLGHYPPKCGVLSTVDHLID